jgi:hypothetical protein
LYLPQERGNYKWKVEPAIAMIKYIQSQNQSIWGFEIGNEINNHRTKCDLQPAIQVRTSLIQNVVLIPYMKSLRLAMQAAAFKLFKEALNKLYPKNATRPKLLGPDVGYLDPEGYLGQVCESHLHTDHKCLLFVMFVLFALFVLRCSCAFANTAAICFCCSSSEISRTCTPSLITFTLTSTAKTTPRRRKSTTPFVEERSGTPEW